MRPPKIILYKFSANVRCCLFITSPSPRVSPSPTSPSPESHVPVPLLVTALALCECNSICTKITVVTRRSQGCLSVLRISRAGGSAQRGISKPKPRENISIEFRKGKSYTTTFAQTLQVLSAR